MPLVTLISAGCSNGSAENGNTGTGSSTGTGRSGGNNTAATHEKAVKFAEFMRENGVTEFPDPDASGEFRYGIKAGSSLDPSSAAAASAGIASAVAFAAAVTPGNGVLVHCLAAN